ncbi:FecR family protein [Dyadobacter sp. CY327]|uniref:FecR family protein n=1 Tax=Dyadobacter sp. CY327 TaxID=2907301 RepID=UPI001F2286A0|nr:FecR family protein [Dyadobacter sp. CY327]MCE7070847.1 FecR family protein [Dyadobacter sp. CY327]
MNSYAGYHVEDFVLDAAFQKWVRYQDPEQSGFWNHYILTNPLQAADIETAGKLLGGVYKQYNVEISESEIEAEITGLISRIRAEKAICPGEPVMANESGQTSRRLFRWLNAAAAVLLICGLVYMYLPRDKTESGVTSHAQKAGFIEKINDTNADQTLQLEDGSIVVLKPKSSLGIPVHFDSNTREVNLSGEGHFKISKDVNRPFLVYANNLVTRVLGTSFIIKAFKDAGETSVEVKEGKVSVFKKEDFVLIASGPSNISKGIVLTPNQKILFEPEAGILTKSLVNAPQVVPSVKTSNFIYRNTPVKDVLTDIENAYQVDIIFDPEMLAECTFTATLSNQPLLEKLAIVCETIEAKYEVLDGQVIIYGKNCLN